jgi:hypothetical protein
MIKHVKKFLQSVSAWANYNPPGALTTEAWHLFNEEFKEKAPIRYYFDKTFPKYFRPIKGKISDLMWGIRYRTYDKYHVIRTGLKPGYYEIDTRMLHCNFSLLVSYVELQLAGMCYLFSDEYEKERWKWNIPFYSHFVKVDPIWGVTSLYRRIEGGKSASAAPSDIAEAEFGKEVLELYTWWTKTRPARHLQKEPLPDYSNQGLGSMAIFHPAFDETAADYVAFTAAYKKNEALKEAWEIEDDEMLIRLVKIRKRLWT